MNPYAQGYGPCYTRVQGRLFLTIEVPEPITGYHGIDCEQSVDMAMLSTTPADAWFPCPPTPTSSILPPANALTFIQGDPFAFTPAGKDQLTLPGYIGSLGGIAGEWPMIAAPAPRAMSSTVPCHTPTPGLCTSSSTLSAEAGSPQGHSPSTSASASSTPPPSKPMRTLNRFSWPTAAPARVNHDLISTEGPYGR